MNSTSLRITLASLVIVPLLMSCGSEPITGDTPVNPVVSVRSELDAKAYATDQDGQYSADVLGNTVDSLEVTSATIVASDLKLHGFDESAQESVGKLRAGQFMLVFEPGGPGYISDVEVLAGTYPKAKFEVHPLHGDLDSLIQTDSRYAEFVTLGPTNSVIIHGHTYKRGVKLPFVFTSALVLNGQFMFKTPLTLESSMREQLRVRFLSQEAFGASGAVLDPTDVRNRASIENNLRSSVGIFRL